MFADRTRALGPVRELLAWYPPDIERYVLAAGWQRLGQQLPFVGRTAEAGDDLGSRLLSAELAGDVMALAFLVSRRWAPYAKWRGTVFRSLPAAAALAPLLATAAAAPGWREREGALAAAAELLLNQQRERVPAAPGRAIVSFFGRPYRTVDDAVPRALLDLVADPAVRGLPPLVGSVGQWARSVDVLSSPGRRAALRATYRNWAGPDDDGPAD